MSPDPGLSDLLRQGVIQLLKPLLADEYVLYTKTHNYHWNVVGPQFNDLHEFFQAQYTALNEVADDVAERIRALGQPAISTLAEFVQHTRLKEHAGHYPGARDIMANLLADNEAVIQRLRVDLGTCAEEYHDMGTNDFLSGLMAPHEKMAWMLRALLDGA
jgi:starvation-inducible DNA-binding protein